MYESWVWVGSVNNNFNSNWGCRRGCARFGKSKFFYYLYFIIYIFYYNFLCNSILVAHWWAFWCTACYSAIYFRQVGVQFMMLQKPEGVNFLILTNPKGHYQINISYDSHKFMNQYFGIKFFIPEFETIIANVDLVDQGADCLCIHALYWLY